MNFFITFALRVKPSLIRLISRPSVSWPKGTHRTTNLEGSLERDWECRGGNDQAILMQYGVGIAERAPASVGLGHVASERDDASSETT